MEHGRLYFLDNLRAFVIILVLVLHTSITYMAFAPEWWYVLDSQNNLFFTAVVLVVDVPIMLTLFFIAGYFVYPSLQRRTFGEFVKSKFIRVGLPWIIGVLLLAPPTAYLILYTNDIPVSLWQFWTGDFWGVWYQQSVYWFLGVLFTIFVVVALLYTAGPLKGMTAQVREPSWLLFVGFGAIMTFGFLAMNQFFPPDTWTPVGYLWMVQPLRVPLYIGYFIFGMMAYQRQWFVEGGYKPGLWWLGLFIVAAILYVGYRFAIPTPTQTTILLQAGNAILFNMVCLSGLMAGTAFFQRYVNIGEGFWRNQAVNSYGIYYVHPLFLYPMALVMTQVSLSAFLKALIVFVVGFLISWAVSELVLRRVPLVRRAF